MSEVIYLDYAASTPIDPRVIEAMRPFHSAANPASSHLCGQEAAAAVDRARERIAALIQARPGEIVFTSGATESDNLAIGGALRAAGNGHLVTTAAEHKAVLDTVRALSPDATILPVDRFGRVDASAVDDAIQLDTVMVSVMLANNEVGTISDTAEIAEICRARGVLFHCDAAQAIGKIPVDISAGFDLLSISAHKLYGPKGIGALWVRRDVRHRLAPVIFGGGHEGGLRSGTLSPSACVGFGEACSIAADLMTGDRDHAINLREVVVNALLEFCPDAEINGDPSFGLPGILNVRLPNVDADGLLLAAPEVAASTGSACTSATPAPSHVLLAMGLTHEQAGQAIRLSFGRFSTAEEATRAAAILGERAPLVSNTGGVVVR